MSFLKIDGQDQGKPHCRKCDRDIEEGEEFDMSVGPDGPVYEHSDACPTTAHNNEGSSAK